MNSHSMTWFDVCRIEYKDYNEIQWDWKVGRTHHPAGPWEGAERRQHLSARQYVVPAGSADRRPWWLPADLLDPSRLPWFSVPGCKTSKNIVQSW